MGVTFSPGSGLGHGLPVGWAGQHCGPGSTQVHCALRWVPGHVGNTGSSLHLDSEPKSHSACGETVSPLA